MPVAALYSTTQVSAGNQYTCALSTAKAVTCWGFGDVLRVPPTAASGIAQLSTGGRHACVVNPAQALSCWGANYNGQTTVPAAAQQGTAQVSAGDDFTCAVSTTGALSCWGLNNFGQATVPAAIQNGMAYVDTGDQFACAVSTAGAVTCWGRNDIGQASAPASTQSGIVEVGVGQFHACARSSAGAVTCWGDNYYGQQNLPSTMTRVQPTAVFTAPASVVEGQPFTLSLTNAQVAGHLGVTFTYAFDCGDGLGYAAPSTAASRSCPTTAAGARAVRAKVIDQDQDATAYTGTVNVTALTPAQRTTALRALVSASALSPDLGRSLTSKLDDALKALAVGKTKAACSALGDFTSQVKAQRGKAIPVATADAWLAETALILTAAGC